MSIGLLVFLAVLSLALTLHFLWKDAPLDIKVLGGFEHSHVPVEVRGLSLDLHYRLTGEDPNKPLVLLIHGLGSSIASWRRLIPQLAEEFRVLAIDLPGFGFTVDTDRRFGADITLIDDLVVEALKKLNLQGPVTVVGNSMGAVVSLSLVEQNPLVFRHAILINPALSPTLAWFPLEQMQWLATPVAKVLRRDMIRLLYHRTVAKPLEIEPEVLDYAASRYVNNPENLKSFARYLPLIRGQKPRTQGAERSLFLFSAGDVVITPRHRDRIRNLYPKSKFVLHPSGGHQLQEDEPEWIKDQIQQFLSSQKG